MSTASTPLKLGGVLLRVKGMIWPLTYICERSPRMKGTAGMPYWASE